MTKHILTWKISADSTEAQLMFYDDATGFLTYEKAEFKEKPVNFAK